MNFSRVVSMVLLSACVLLGSACGSSDSGIGTCDSTGKTCPKTGGLIELCCTSTQCRYTTGGQDFMCTGIDCLAAGQAVANYCEN